MYVTKIKGESIFDDKWGDGADCSQLGVVVHREIGVRRPAI